MSNGLIEEDHYYAHGLKIAAISSKAVASSLNPKAVSYGYQGSFSEEVSDFELNYNEFALRTYDPQIGRWTTPDPYDEFPSPYTGMGNDPANNVDPSGGNIFSAIWSFLGGTGGSMVSQMGCPGATAAVNATASGVTTAIRIATASLAVGGSAVNHVMVNAINANLATVGGNREGGTADLNNDENITGGINRTNSVAGDGSNLGLGLDAGDPEPKKGFIGPGLAPLLVLQKGTQTIEISTITRPKLGPSRYGRFFGWFFFLCSFEGDNFSVKTVQEWAAKDINDALSKGEYGKLDKLSNYEFKKVKIKDEIVFRYVSERELLTIDGGYLQNKGPQDNWVKKYVTPTLYLYPERAKSRLALPSAPKYVIWTFKSMIRPTLVPQNGWRIVKPGNEELGGGLEGTINQPFPVMGIFELRTR
jgi:RHS repeat-associated protein